MTDLRAPISFAPAEHMFSQSFTATAVMRRNVHDDTVRTDPHTGAALSPLEQDLRWCTVRFVARDIDPTTWDGANGPLLLASGPGEITVSFPIWIAARHGDWRDELAVLPKMVLEAGVDPTVDPAALTRLLTAQGAAITAFHAALAANDQRAGTDLATPTEAAAAARQAAAERMIDALLAADAAAPDVSERVRNRALLLAFGRAFPAASQNLDGTAAIRTVDHPNRTPWQSTLGDVGVYQKDSMALRQTALHRYFSAPDVDRGLAEAVVTILSGLHLTHRWPDNDETDTCALIGAAHAAVHPPVAPAHRWVLQGPALLAAAADDIARVASWPISAQAEWAAAVLLEPRTPFAAIAQTIADDTASPMPVRLKNPAVILEAVRTGVLDGPSLGQALTTLVLHPGPQGSTAHNMIRDSVLAGIPGDARGRLPGSVTDHDWLSGSTTDTSQRRKVLWNANAKPNANAKQTAAAWCLLAQALGWDGFPTVPSRLNDLVVEALPSVATTAKEQAAEVAAWWAEWVALDAHVPVGPVVLPPSPAVASVATPAPVSNAPAPKMR